MPFRRIIARMLFGGTLCAACASPAAHPSVGPIAAGPDRCIVGSGGRDTVVVALEDTVRVTSAPVPANDAERLVFRQTYESLIRLDCERVIRPALAARWSGDSSGTVWTLELGAHTFAGGDTVTAGDVVDSWRWQGLGMRPAVGGLTVRDSRTLVITLPIPAPGGPALLADAGFAVSGPAAAGGWPQGTRPPGPVVEYRTAGDADLRDLLATGADLAMTRDPEVLAYAERLAEFSVTPLPWDRTYLLVSTAAPVMSAGRDSAERARFRAELARDVVTAASRAAVPPAMSPCRATVLLPLDRPPLRRRRIVYPRGDRTARELAERIVALSSANLTLQPAAFEDLAHRLINRADLAYVVPFPLGEPTPCAGHPPVLSMTATVEPLVDTRAHLILRRGTMRASIDADGTPRILPPEAP
jgi:hypothetical protein